MFTDARSGLRPWGMFIAMALMGSACNCGGGKTMGSVGDAGCADVCCSDTDCQNAAKQQGDPNYTNFACKNPGTAQATCVQSRTECKADGDCCPGQVCSQTLGVCSDSFTSCTVGDSSACGAVGGQVCEATLGNFPQGPGWSFAQCQSDSDCSAGLSCFDNYCVGGAPCNGSCPAGSVCTPVNDSCFSLDGSSGSVESRFPASCSQTCASGSILVFTDGLNVFNECNTSATDLACSCETLPPLSANNTALYSSAVLAGSQILVSAYDSVHGDLVLHTFTLDDPSNPTEASGSPIWIDGVPSGAPIVADPNGPRGGIAEDGPNVGEYTSIAYDATSSTTHISYYDVADAMGNPTGNLKYARRTGTGSWTIMIVDGVNSSGAKTADVGLFTSITLAPDGSPVIAYFQQSGMGANPQQTAVWVARASSPTPMSASDWTITMVDGYSLPPPACPGGCTGSTSCGQDFSGDAPTCYAMTSGCSCDAGFCGTDSTGATTCFTPVETSTSNLAGVPAGIGLWPSIAYASVAGSNVPMVVYYDETNGQLKGAIAASDSDQGVEFADGGVTVLDNGMETDGGIKDNVGQFTSLAVGPSNVSNPIAISYFDATAQQLLMITGQPGWTNLTWQVVDNGANTSTPDPVLFVGADSSVEFNGSDVWVAYQDSTGLSLRLAEQSASGPVEYTTTLDSGEACGFYTKLVIGSSSQYVSNAVIKATSATETNDVLKVIRVP